MSSRVRVGPMTVLERRLGVSSPPCRGRPERGGRTSVRPWTDAHRGGRRSACSTSPPPPAAGPPPHTPHLDRRRSDRRWLLAWFSRRLGRGCGYGAGEDDGAVANRQQQQHQRRRRRHRRGERTRQVGVGSDDGVDRVRGHRHHRPGGQQRPRIPGGTLPRERDDDDGCDDDDAVHDQRPRHACPASTPTGGQDQPAPWTKARTRQRR